MNDWGGPIGLDFARRHPERVKRLVIANTWCWPVGDDFHFRSFSFLMSSWIGQYLLRQHNIFVNGVMPRAVGDRSVLTPEIMAHYRGAQPSPAARAASAALPGYIVGASDWLRSIWEDRAAFADKPALVLWGLKDIAFRRKELERWKSALRDVEVRDLRIAGTLWRRRRRGGWWRRFGGSWDARSAGVPLQAARQGACERHCGSSVSSRELRTSSADEPSSGPPSRLMDLRSKPDVDSRPALALTSAPPIK